MRIPNKITLLKALTLGVITLFAAPNAFSVTAVLSPDHISVNSLYHGSKIEISGEAAADSEVIIKITSAEKKEHLRKKGKAGGVLWMNVGELEFSPVSDVFLVYSTGDINELLSTEQQDKYVIGYGALKRSISVEPVEDEADKEKWVDEFIKLKQKNKIYGEFTGQIKTMAEGVKKTYTLAIDWPYQAPPQDYNISVYEVRDDVVQAEAGAVLKIEKVGALKYISDMAFHREVIYGIGSILIAIAAGFIVSVIFKGGGGSH
jgi:hypothetical protein